MKENNTVQGESERSGRAVQYEGKLSELCKYQTLRVNLIITTLKWVVMTIGYFMVNFLLKYLAGNIYTNSYTTGCGEIVGKLTAGYMIYRFGLKKLYLVAFGLGIAGLLLMLAFINFGAMTPYLVFVTKFGYSMGFVGVYFNIVLLFPTILKSSSMGFCNLLGRIAGMCAPIIAELPPPINLIIWLVATIIALIASQFLIDPKTERGNSESELTKLRDLN